MDLSPLDSLLQHLNKLSVMPSPWEEVFDVVALLKALLTDPPEQFVEDGTLKELQSLAGQVESVIFSFDLKDMDIFMSFELEMQLFILLMPVRDWKYEAQRISDDMESTPSGFHYPTIGQLVFIDHLVENLQKLVKSKPSSTHPLKRFILRLRRNLQICSSDLKETPEQESPERGMEKEDLMKSITNLAYEAEHAIDSFLVGNIPIWHCMLWLLNILDKFKLFGIGTNDKLTDGIVVGFEEETKEMLDQLIRPSTPLRIVSIVGMAGQGKTTLAKKLYSDPSVIRYFDTCSWCRVSQAYEKRELLLELLGQLVQLSDKIHQKSDVELAEMLYKHLKGRRFLIFLDDIWKIDAWNELMRCFPDEKNGSRIMFTTRMEELASQSNIMLQTLRPLTDDESWELLEKKLFQKERCPPHLLDIGRQIATNCKGLPLSVVLTAGILAKMENKADQWEYIARTLSSHILSNAEHGKGVIELSYNHLPDHLRPCFLYFGAFLEDREILVSKLIRLWIAEGFIKTTDLMSLEVAAENHLIDLIRRSLVTVAQEKCNGGVKSCRVHDLLREFCLNKAKEENFLQIIYGYDELFPSANDNLDYGLDSHHSCSSTPITYQLRRLSIYYSKRKHFIKLKPSGPLVRSLLFFAASDMCPTYSYDISFIPHNFKLLRILVLEDINIGGSFKAIDVLVRLRYLAVQGNFESVPSSITNLKDLETFHVKGLEAKVVKVSSFILDMKKLRHLHINDSVSFDLDPEKLENSSILDNLQTLSSPSLAYGDNLEKMIRKLQGIKKLKCIFLDSWDDARNCNCLPRLEVLSQLVSLKVSYNGTRKYHCEFNFPSNLKKLTLSNFQLPWNLFPQLASLCNLEFLKLLANAFDGETWEMADEEFPKLKFLKLETLNFLTWSAFDENFPCLKHLVLNKCKQLEEIPPGIGDISTLEMIEVTWCNPDLATSARNIQDEYGEGLKVHILPKVWDSESSSKSE